MPRLEASLELRIDALSAVAAEGVGAASPCKLLIARWFYNTSAPTLHF